VYALLSAVDEAWRARDEPGRLEEIEALRARAEEAAPRGYGVLWRFARLYAWAPDGPARSAAERSRLGKKRDLDRVGALLRAPLAEVRREEE
jgi:hypothetical protein